MSKLFSDKGGIMPPKTTSAKVHIPVGSGSRPVRSKIMIDSSAPANAKKLDSRFVPGALGYGNGNKNSGY